jgi:PPOX class probable F420-dependent enzyme
VANQRDRITMTDSEIEAFLAQCRTLILCTIGPDGVPDPVPMWFVPRADGLYMRTYAKSQKVANLRRDPRCSVLAELGDRYAELRGVQYTGTVDVSTDVDLICELFADLMVKYEQMDPAHRESASAGYRAKASQMVALRLVPQQIVSWDHRKLAAAHGS